MADKLKMLVALLLVVAGVAGFYILRDGALVVRVLSVLVGVLLAAGAFWTTGTGKVFFGFARDSVAEAKRVSWPTRKETLQTTGVVILFAVVMALFLWAVDAILLSLVNLLRGE